MTDRSFDAITRHAVRRMTDKANGDMAAILRIHAKARDLREHRAAQRFIDRLMRPVSPEVRAAILEPLSEVA